MDNRQELDANTEAKAHAICEGITVAHGLDEEIQKELYGHIEDKLLGYVRGEIPVSEDDALILVREHFGDAATIKSLFQDVHIVEAAVSQGRRLLVAAITTMACLLVGTILIGALSVGVSYGDISSEIAPTSVDSFRNAWSYPIFLLLIACTYLMPWLFLIRWNRKLEAGIKPWFFDWSARRLGLLLFGLVALYVALPNMGVSWVGPMPSWGVPIFMVLGVGMYMGQCVSWIWWCDVAPRVRKNMLNAARMWLLGFTILSIIPKPSLHIVANSEAAISHGFGSYTIPLGHFLNTAAEWGLSWPSLGQSFMAGGFAFVSMALIAMLATALYAGIMRWLEQGKDTRPLPAK